MRLLSAQKTLKPVKKPSCNKSRGKRNVINSKEKTKKKRPPNRSPIGSVLISEAAQIAPSMRPVLIPNLSATKDIAVI